jgi:hypothetical protein
MSHGPYTCDDCGAEYERHPHVCKPMPLENMRYFVQGMIEEAFVEERSRLAGRIRKFASERQGTTGEIGSLLAELADAIEKNEDDAGSGGGG